MSTGAGRPITTSLTRSGSRPHLSTRLSSRSDTALSTTSGPAASGTATLSCASTRPLRSAIATCGSAPDTFLGSASQTARKALDAGRIGTPIGASAFIGHSKAETWHPDPRFLFQPGGGPVMDMGPYYFAILVNLLGPVRSVTAASRIGAPTRTVTAPERAVDSIEVTVPTHAGAVLTFASGVIGTTQMSFDVWDTDLPFMEIYGTEGTLSLPNPNHFDGDVRLRRHGETEWRVLEPTVGPFGAVGTREQARRGLGVRDLADAVEGGPHRANASFAFHVLEALCAVDEASRQGRVVELDSTCDRPRPRY